MPSEQQRAKRPIPADLHDIRRCLDGDTEAFRGLVERYQSRVGAIMWPFSRDPDVHEDLVQEVFLEAFEGIGRFRGDAPFWHWLARIATRVGYRHWKREKRSRGVQMVSIDECRELAEHDPDETDAAEVGRVLHELLQQLPARDRLVLTLRLVEDLSVERTAELTGWSQTMVKVQTWRARKKLLSLFERAHGEEAS